MSGAGISRLDPHGPGMPAEELWGKAMRDHRKPRLRGPDARARRRAKRTARARGIPLKVYLREQTP